MEKLCVDMQRDHFSDYVNDEKVPPNRKYYDKGVPNDKSMLDNSEQYFQQDPAKTVELL